MVDMVFKLGGFLNELIGDALMAVSRLRSAREGTAQIIMRSDSTKLSVSVNCTSVPSASERVSA